MKDIFEKKDYIKTEAEGEITMEAVKKSFADGNVVGLEVHGPDKITIKILIEPASINGMYKVTIDGVPGKEEGIGILTEKEVSELLEKATGSSK